jgi:hypothetical protein
MRLEERKNISSRRIKIREASIKTQSRWPGMSETFHREPTHDGIIVRSGTDGLFERRVIVWVRDESIDPKSDKRSISDEGCKAINLLKLTEGWPSNRVMTCNHCELPMPHGIA